VSTSDAVVVGDSWISEHYFTKEAKSESFLAKVLTLRKEWDEAGKDSPRARFLDVRRALEHAFAELGDDAVEGAGPDRLTAIRKQLVDILGFERDGLVTQRTGCVVAVFTPGLTMAAPLVLVEATAVDSPEALLAKDAPTLTEPYAVDDTTTVTSVARLLTALFVADDAPAFALVLAGRWALVAEQARWAEGRYLAVDLQLVCERNDTRRGGEIDRALTCLAAQSLAPDADGQVWWKGVLEESVRHTVGVSKDLREGVRLSIEIIANEVVRRRAAQGLPSLAADRAQPLAMQSLRFLYRILFLLYAEASPELAVLPVGQPEYQQGYSLDRLRDLTLVDLTTTTSRSGTHLYESLRVLYRLVDSGPWRHPAGPEAVEPDAADPVTGGLTFRQLRADLFRPEATALIDEVGLGNAALQEVLRHLLLSKEARGKDRGFISYAELGINQLGAVYEGLMSYTGFFAGEDLYEVAKNGDPGKGSWVVPVTRSQGIAAADFVRGLDPRTGENKAVLHERGTFVFRLAGRERQQSASYYTPEVLTRFTVGQALDELLGERTEKLTAREILDLTICEPALGSGAFAIEAVRQLAERYLRKAQQETGEKIDPEDHQRRLQEVKAYLALHQVYGVDLNATAVELAEISLWLDTMGEGLDAPWFGLHLRRGNSLIGARRALFRRSQLAKRSWLKDIPDDAPLTSLAQDVADGTLATGITGRIHHFLLPAEGWGSAVNAKDAADLAPDALARLRDWRRTVLVTPTKEQTAALVDLAHRVERLWQIALARLQIAEREIRRSIPVWGATDLPVGGAVQREQIEAALADAGGAFGRLKRVMDAWCALWFWPLTDTLTTRDVDGQQIRISPPSLPEWIDALRSLLGYHDGKRKQPQAQQRFDAGTTWQDLDRLEELDLGFACLFSIDDVLAKHPWLVVCERIAAQQGFFHWELEFAPVFARGGFDLQLGNPPWVRPRSDVDALLAEGDPWWQLALKPSEAERRERKTQTLALPGIRDLVVDGTADVAATAAFVGDAQHYPHLTGLQPDLYRCFMEQTWRHASERGTIGLIHPEKHFTDEKAGPLRRVTYRRLRRHWHFVNELMLFQDIGADKFFGVHVYGCARDPAFKQASWLYHPDTVYRSLKHDGSGPEPGLKDPDGRWDVRPHKNRIVSVTVEMLKTWHEVLETPEFPVRQARMFYALNRAAADVLEKLGGQPRAGTLPLEFSAGWHEKNDRTKGLFIIRWGKPDSWDDVILQGPHLFIATPMYKSPNPTLLNNQDWSETDFETLPPDSVPVTAYKPAGDRDTYDEKFTHWGDDANPIPARDHFRIGWRFMASAMGMRTLVPALIPPGAGHTNGVVCVGLPSEKSGSLSHLAGVMSSLLADSVVRVVPKSVVCRSVIERLPLGDVNHPLSSQLILRLLRLNCLVGAYAGLWERSWDSAFLEDAWTNDPCAGRRLNAAERVWTAATPLRVASERRQALVEIDSLVALMLGVTADELCTIYRTQFPVLYGYDQNRDFYDVNGRLVPNSVLTVWRKKGERISEAERTATNQAGNTYTYEPPFVTLDREHDMRVAYAEFERRLKERS
jgi:hypothetical protein